MNLLKSLFETLPRVYKVLNKLELSKLEYFNADYLARKCKISHSNAQKILDLIERSPYIQKVYYVRDPLQKSSTYGPFEHLYDIPEELIRNSPDLPHSFRKEEGEIEYFYKEVMK